MPSSVASNDGLAASGISRRLSEESSSSKDGRTASQRRNSEGRTVCLGAGRHRWLVRVKSVSALGLPSKGPSGDGRSSQLRHGEAAVGVSIGGQRVSL
mmetsp:Transcript_39683/g.127166  ORF Transcript_39683/g.127166 Transcript_39683/m.127166 type:complete len:98 (+) Transcript_39683:67-360(+)